MTQCAFLRDWAGRCRREVSEPSRYCVEHLNTVCLSCGDQATHSCEDTGQFVCGTPLCDYCTGNGPVARGHVHIPKSPRNAAAQRIANAKSTKTPQENIATPPTEQRRVEANPATAAEATQNHKHEPLYDTLQPATRADYPRADTCRHCNAPIFHIVKPGPHDEPIPEWIDADTISLDRLGPGAITEEHRQRRIRAENIAEFSREAAAPPIVKSRPTSTESPSEHPDTSASPQIMVPPTDEHRVPTQGSDSVTSPQITKSPRARAEGPNAPRLALRADLKTVRYDPTELVTLLWTSSLIARTKAGWVLDAKLAAHQMVADFESIPYDDAARPEHLIGVASRLGVDIVWGFEDESAPVPLIERRNTPKSRAKKSRRS